MEKNCHRTVPRGSRSNGRSSGGAWLTLSADTSARKINSGTDIVTVRVGIVYSNCTVATVHIGNSVH